MSLYHQGSRQLQDRFDTRRLADRLEERLISDSISTSDGAFIGRADHFFLATVSPDGFPTVSYKGGATGFVKILDERTLAFPSYNGNGMFLSMGNVVGDSPVGMLFIDWERGSRLRLHGSATIDHDDPLLNDYQEAQLIVRVATTAVFPNCPRYIHDMRRQEQSAFIPREGRRTPVPDWKRSEWASDVLPLGDPALDPEAPVL